MGAPAAIDQDSFQWFDDDSGSSTPDNNTSIHAANTNLSAPAYDTSYFLRFLLQNTGGKDGTFGFQAWFTVDAGTPTQITTTSSFVRSVATAGTWNDGQALNQLMGGGTYDEGYADENNGSIASYTIVAGQESEVGWVIQFRSADFTGNEVVDIYVRYDTPADVDTYTNRTSTTMPEAEQPWVEELNVLRKRRFDVLLVR